MEYIIYYYDHYGETSWVQQVGYRVGLFYEGTSNRAYAQCFDKDKAEKNANDLTNEKGKVFRIEKR